MSGNVFPGTEVVSGRWWLFREKENMSGSWKGTPGSLEQRGTPTRFMNSRGPSVLLGDALSDGAVPLLVPSTSGPWEVNAGQAPRNLLRIQTDGSIPLQWGFLPSVFDLVIWVGVKVQECFPYVLKSQMSSFPLEYETVKQVPLLMAWES